MFILIHEEELNFSHKNVTVYTQQYLSDIHTMIYNLMKDNDLIDEFAEQFDIDPDKDSIFRDLHSVQAIILEDHSFKTIEVTHGL